MKHEHSKRKKRQGEKRKRIGGGKKGRREGGWERERKGETEGGIPPKFVWWIMRRKSLCGNEIELWIEVEQSQVLLPKK